MTSICSNEVNTVNRTINISVNYVKLWNIYDPFFFLLTQLKTSLQESQTLNSQAPVCLSSIVHFSVHEPQDPKGCNLIGFPCFMYTHFYELVFFGKTNPAT